MMKNLSKQKIPMKNLPVNKDLEKGSMEEILLEQSKRKVLRPSDAFFQSVKKLANTEDAYVN
jgi:hypothetical protein